ncbi:uridine kinase [Oryzihumus sp.]|uniref:uridine kinase n=1 Tax=Oryzihumus sp. TaxID=1968903 RepID=UPI002ED80D1E
MTGRDAVLAWVAERVEGLPTDRVRRVGVDGVDGAGKTVFADELAVVLSGRGVLVVRASVDGFHHPAQVRHRRGRHSPEGFFRDSYDYVRMREALLDPVAPGGSGLVRTAVNDVATDTPVELAPVALGPGDVLLVDGIFLHRPELRPCWDWSVFLQVDFAVSVPRGAARDGTDPDPAADSQQRYVQGQRLYLAECAPYRHASAVIDNADLAAPRVLRGS